jgi:hypothetical protein
MVKDLKLEAKDIYFNDILVEKYRDNFLLELDKRIVVDKRDEGYRCGYCGKFNKKPIAYPSKNTVIFPKENNNQIWILNNHYDGCRGWD